MLNRLKLLIFKSLISRMAIFGTNNWESINNLRKRDNLENEWF